jgi:alanine racemase
VLGYVPLELAPLAVEADLTLTVNTPEMAVALSRAVRQSRRRVEPLPIHLKLDTGLHRYGLTPDEALSLARRIATLPGLTMQALYTHFATGEEADQSFIIEQTHRFDDARQRLAAAGFTFPQEHLANSASGITYGPARRSFVRFGLAMYGYYGSPTVEATAREAGVRLQPCLTLKSLAVRLSDLPAGETVGYNRTFRAETPRRLALVPFGYADGYRRALGNRGAILLNGQRAPVVGRVSMDQITVDITGLTGIEEGDEAVLVGRQEADEISLEEVAALCDTIPYEIMTGLGPRVKRVYVE